MYHASVLKAQVLDNLKVEKGKRYLDATLGDGGYGLEILKLGGELVGIDQDQEAIARSEARFNEEGFKSYRLIKANFRDLGRLVTGTFTAILFDLGVSSYQLNSARRGFSFMKEAELDMRMDQNLTVKAADLVNGLHKAELEKLLEKYGQMKDRRVAAAIIKAREQAPVTSTLKLAQIIEQAVGHAGKTHPATQAFQALRMAVNDELHSLEEALPQALEKLEKGGRLLVISFHSLEDRIVKNYFKQSQALGLAQVLTDKPIVPTRTEVEANPRSRSSKLRILQKI